MSLAHTILGVLLDAPGHGYSIKKSLGEALPQDIALNDGQLYPALARLEARGWIAKEVVEQRRSPTKHLYRITDDGRDAFYRWIDGEPDGETPLRPDLFWRSGFLQKCNFFRYLEPGRVATRVVAEIGEVERRIAQLEACLEDLEDCEPDPYRRAIVEYGIRYQRMRRDWLEELRGRADARTGGDSAPARVAHTP